MARTVSIGKQEIGIKINVSQFFKKIAEEQFFLYVDTIHI